MKGRLAMSLNLRLWVVVLLAVLPIFTMVAVDYQAQRRSLAHQLEGDVLRMLKVAVQQEGLALDAVRGTLKVMAHANDLRDLDPQACSGLARRMLETLTDYNNLGAALPDGRVFCSGRGAADAVSVHDRTWFIDAQTAAGITRGDYVLGRISGQPSLVFGYPLRGEGGELRAVLFASIGFRWFNRLLAGYGLPAGWDANLISLDGVALAGSSVGEQGRSLPPERLEALLGISRTPDRFAETIDSGGKLRLYGIPFHTTPSSLAILPPPTSADTEQP